MSFDFERAESSLSASLRGTAAPDNFDRQSYYENSLPFKRRDDDDDVLDGRFLIMHRDEKKEKAPDVPQKTIDDYVKSFENLNKNGACNKETLDAFKETVKSLPKMDAKGLEAALKKAAGDAKVDMPLVMQHIREILKASGYIQIDGGLPDKKNEGGLFWKHPDTEVYVSMQYLRKDGKADARVEVERKKD